ncbi:MAG: PKD domain-containing protein [Bacteroidota bacterium]
MSYKDDQETENEFSSQDHENGNGQTAGRNPNTSNNGKEDEQNTQNEPTADNPEHNWVFKTGYQLGLAGKENKLKETLDKYQAALKELGSTRDELIERSQDSISQSLHSIVLLTNLMRRLMDELEEDQMKLLNTLSVKLATVETYEGDPQTFWSEFKVDLKQAYTSHKDALSLVNEKLGEQLQNFKFQNSINRLEQELKNYIDSHVENLDQQIQLQLGFNKGESVASQISNLTGNGQENPIVAVASADPTSGLTPLVVKFTSKGSSQVKKGVISSYKWDFGDGSSSTSPDPIHTYIKKGKYTAKLTVSNNGVEHSKTVVIDVQDKASSS